MRRNIVAGNWKMNLSRKEAIELVNEIVSLSSRNGVEFILAPPFVYLDLVQSIVSDLNHISVAAQNMHQSESGAFTGEVSATMLASSGVDYVILGHSERRQFFHESDALIFDKIKQALAYGITPIYCCGEVLKERQQGNFENVVRQQMSDSVLRLNKDELERIVIAYEPVWAIGTGETASPEQAQEMHAFIRSLLVDASGTSDVSVLYGGSVKPGNAPELFGQEDVDGGLIGGASLNSEDFISISSAFNI